MWMEPKTFEMVLPLIAIAVSAVALVPIGLIAFALRKEREGKDVAFEVQRLGISLKGDRVTAFALLFCVLALIPMGVWYLWQRDRSVTEELKTVRLQVKSTEDALQRFKVYDLRINPTFREPIDARRLKDKVQVWVRKPGEAIPKLGRALSDVGPSNDLWVYPEGLGPGDKLRIVVELDGQRWAADEMEIPRTQMQMVKQ